MLLTHSRHYILLPVGAVFLPLLLLSCVLYYWAFAADLNNYDGKSGTFQYALNSHDHHIYANNVDSIRAGDIPDYQLGNDVGIAILYLALTNIFPFLVDQDYTLIALVFNCAILVFCYVIYSDICSCLHLGILGKLSFFANLYFIYFAQLINKDMLTVFAFLLAVQCGIRGRLWLLLVLLPLSALVRQQLAVFMLIVAYLMPCRHLSWRIPLVYIVTSLTAGYITSSNNFVSEESFIDAGISSFLYDFNRRYFCVAYLLFNPVRIVQLIFVIYGTLWYTFNTGTGGIDTAMALYIPQLFVLLFLMKPLGSLVLYFRYWLGTPARPMVLVIVAYLMAWLMNPTINARYVMLITPVLVLFALYARRHPTGQLS